MSRASQLRVPPRNRSARWMLAVPAILVATLALPTGAGASVGHSPGTLLHVPTAAGPLPTAAGAPTVATPRAPAEAPAPHPSITAFNPPCYPVDTGICVSIQNPGEPQIIPLGNNRASSVMPSWNVSLPLLVRAHDWQNYTGAPAYGPHAPIAINVTGVLWNGDPYYSPYDNSIWHANARQWWQYVGESTNKSYPHLYLVNITAKGANGQANFFAGETITWWIYLVHNTNNQSYLNHEGPHLHYTYAGAWPYSPYPGAAQYGGPASTFLDVNITASPRTPNWNDSVHITVNTTPADVSPYNATIGSVVLDFVEVSHGVVVANTSVPFNVSVTNGVGNYTTSSVIPARYAQVEGAVVSYRLWISDASKPGDMIVTPWTNYTVSGNGSFDNGIFASDLIINMVPLTVLTSQTGYANLTPGQPLALLIQSRNPTTAILSAEIQYRVDYPLLKESLAQSVFLHRHSSTLWSGSIPGLPVQSIVNFTILAWDFTDAVETSEVFSYTVQTFDQFVGPVPLNLAFFYVYVYDNGSGKWVQGADVQITGPGGVFNSVSNTTLGVAYANGSGTPYTPLLLQANATYNVTVNDPYFVPFGGSAGQGYGPVTVSVVALNRMTAHQPLATTPYYIVLQQGNQILFYLNGTAPPPVSSPSVASSSPIGNLGIAAVLGLVAAGLAVIPLRLWWRQIKARRTAEEKRVTL